MGATFTANEGYQGLLTFGGDTIHVMGNIDVGVNRALKDISCLGDGVVPFRTHAVGMHDPVTITVDVPWDPSNDGVTEIYTHKVAGTTDTLILYDESGVTTLLSGLAYANYSFQTGLDGIQILRTTFTYSGALTGTLVA